MTNFEFEAFIGRHRERHPFAKLPDFAAAAAMYQAWWKVLMKHGVFDVTALDEASSRMLTEPARTHLLHFPTLCAYAEDAMRRSGRMGPPRPSLDTREGAELASKGCDRCGGAGLTTVWHPRPDPERRIAPTATAYCVCAMGRWVERSHRERSPEDRKRIPDLVDVLAGRSVWLAESPNIPSLCAADEDF